MNETQKETIKRLRDADPRVPLVSPRTKDYKAGTGKQAAKTLTQAVKEAKEWAEQAKAMRDDALKSASEADIHNKASWGAKAEADAACARAVLLCACIALCELVPALLVLYFLFFR